MNSAWFTTWSARRRARARPARVAAGAAEQGEPGAERDDPDVLDAVVREEPLEVVLRERERDAEHGRGAAEEEERDPPRRGRRVEEAGDAQEPVDPGLDEHAGHDGRDVRRRRRVRARQPEVERHEPGLEAEADERERERERRAGPAPASPCIAANSNDPAVCRSSANSAKSAIVPTWVAARYRKAARCTSARS